MSIAQPNNAGALLPPLQAQPCRLAINRSYPHMISLVLVDDYLASLVWDHAACANKGAIEFARDLPKIQY
jgi:hypothetical protein